MDFDTWDATSYFGGTTGIDRTRLANESREANSRPQKDVASYVHGGDPNAGVWPNQAPISQISSDRLGTPSRLETSTVVPAVAVAAP